MSVTKAEIGNMSWMVASLKSHNYGPWGITDELKSKLLLAASANKKD
jgi:hypothetical protein